MKLYKYNSEQLQYDEVTKFKGILFIPLFFLILLTSFIKAPNNKIYHNPIIINNVITEIDTTPLTKENVWQFIQEIKILHPKVVYQQMIVETNNFKSKICIENNNLVGQRVEAINNDGTYRYPHYNIKKIKNRDHLVFANWKLSLIHYKEFQNYNYIAKDWNYYNFLTNLGYAEAPNYINVLKSINTP